jgi:hypothetical protein
MPTAANHNQGVFLVLFMIEDPPDTGVVDV